MRCFIAIDLPKDVKKELSLIQDRIPEARMALVKLENIHLTMKFLGEISESDVEKVKNALGELKFKKFRAKLSGIGVFPGPAFIKVVWVGVGPKDKFEELHATTECMLEEAGFAKDFDFENHATLARVKFIPDKASFIKKLGEIKVKPIEFNVEGLCLRKSILTEEGPIYEDLMKVDFV